MLRGFNIILCLQKGFQRKYPKRDKASKQTKQIRNFIQSAISEKKG
jgi:hypothetical protein